VTLTFVEPRGPAALHDARRLPGVIYAEPFRVEEFVLSHAGRTVREAVFGVPQDARLSLLIADGQRRVAPPASGILLARALADKLAVAPGQSILVEQTRGRRTRAEVRVAGIVEPLVGSSAYMEIGAFSRMIREPGRVSGAHLALDPAHYRDFNTRIKETPAIAGASFLALAERQMRRSFDEGVGVMNFVYTLFAAVMAGGVAFSSARVTFAEQERDLATLRVLGFSRLEVSYVLIGELMALALLSLPAGLLGGTALAMWLMALFETDMYSFPFVFNPGGYAFAVWFSLVCVLAAAMLVRRGVDRLDLVGVLKARD
jgi:putative ABC transport system permease protein